MISCPWRTYYNPQSNNVRKGVFIFFILYLSTCIFAFWADDTYHIWNLFLSGSKFTKYEISSFESVYNKLAAISANNYFLWRTYIYLPACLFLFFIAKKLDLLHRNLLLAMILFGSMQSYSRAMLGHTMLLLGAVLMVSKDSKSVTKLIGLALFCLSYFFHKSMYVNIIFAIIAFAPINKNIFIISLIAFPFLTSLASLLIHNIAAGTVDFSFGEGVGGVGDRTLYYVTGSKRILTFNGWIPVILRTISEYLVLIYLINRVLYKGYFKGIKGEKIYTYLFKLTYVTIYIASLFAFVDTSSWIFSRFKYMAFFPLPFVLAKIFSLEPRTNKWVKVIILYQIFVLFFLWFSKLYSWSKLV